MTCSLNILHVVENFGGAGLETVVKDLVLATPHEQAHNVSVCSLNSHSLCGDILKQQGFNVWDLNWKKRRISSFTLIRDIRNIVKHEKIDIIHAHNYVPFYFSCFAAFSLNTKIIVTFHGFQKWVPFSLLTYPFLYFLAQRIVTVSESMNRHYRPFFSAAPKKVFSIVNGIDVDRFSLKKGDVKRADLGLNEDDFVVGSVGRLSPVKNQVAQIRICHMLKNSIPNIKLLMVTGSSPDSSSLKSELIALAKQLDISDRIVILPFRKDVPDILKCIDIFLMTSITEGTSLALLEAMSSGLPVVASDVGGNSQIVEQNLNGFLFDINDPANSVKLITDLYNDHGLREKIGRAAAKRASLFSIRTMAENYAKVYHSL